MAWCFEFVCGYCSCYCVGDLWVGCQPVLEIHCAMSAVSMRVPRRPGSSDDVTIGDGSYMKYLAGLGGLPFLVMASFLKIVEALLYNVEQYFFVSLHNYKWGIEI